ncbi:MAG: transcriptional regulator, GntR family [Chloroflexi bacterium]|nr:transcriptional regulator, GntR family [Chloroflexota bacterium]
MLQGTQDRRPLAERVREDLAHRIRSAEFKQGQQLPTEAELARVYDVSRMTIREAIKGLQRDHLLFIRRGQGTFVTHMPIQHPITLLQTGSELATELGFALTTKVLSLEIEPAQEAASNALAIPIGTPLARLERLRCVDAVPALYSIDRFEASWVEGERPLEAWEGSLFSYIFARTGRSITHSSATLRAVTLDVETSSHINAEPGIAWFVMEQVNYDAENRSLVYSVDYHKGDLFSFEVMRRRAEGSAMKGTH